MVANITKETDDADEQLFLHTFSYKENHNSESDREQLPFKIMRFCARVSSKSSAENMAKLVNFL